MNEMKDRTKGAIDNKGDRGRSGDNFSAPDRNPATSIMDTVKEGAESAVNTVTEFATDAKDKVGQWTSDATGAARSAIGCTTDTMKEFSGEVTDFVKKYPIQAVLVGFGVGLLIGRTVRS